MNSVKHLSRTSDVKNIILLFSRNGVDRLRKVPDSVLSLFLCFLELRICVYIYSRASDANFQ